MPAITASMVGALRAKTDAPMMECKKALTEADGDMERAEEILRVKLGSKAGKASSRITAEGVVAAAGDDRTAALVEVNCETDFAARNEAFQDLVRNIAKVALAHGGDHARTLAAQYPHFGKPVSDTITDAVATIGENMNFRRSARLGVEKGAVASYVHNAVSDGLGKIGVLVAIETEGNADAAKAFARQVAMHVAATNPLSLDVDALDPAAVERERAIFSDQARASGKPENVIEKMIEGRLRKFYEEVVMLKQAFVMNPDVTVEKALKDAEKEIGAPAKITGFIRYAVGDGIEKEESDFAAEVAAAVKH